MKKGLWSEHFASAADKPTTPTVDTSPDAKKGLWLELFAAVDKPTTPTVVTPPDVHWSQHLPASDKPSPPPPPPPPRRDYERCLLCDTCNATCRLRTSSTEKNPGRQYYTCPAPAHDHKIFKWVNELNPYQFIDVPNCGGCGAGTCRVRRDKFGPNAGRILFMCRIKEGEGSCGYRVWQDELEMSETGPQDEGICPSQSTINCDDISAADTDLVEEIKNADKGADIITPMINTSEHLRCREIISPKMGQSKYQEDKPNESSRRPYKRSRCGDVKASGLLVSTRSLEVLLPVNNVPIECSWMNDAKQQNLTSQLNGWWGRLVFHPMPCLMTYESNPFTCYLSSPLDSTFVLQDPSLVNNIDLTTPTRSNGGAESDIKPLFNLKKCSNTLVYIPAVQEKILENSRDSTTITWNLLEAESYSKPPISPCPQNTELFRGALDVPSLSGTKIQNVLSNSISTAFCQAAQHLQNDLLTLLERMDAKDHMAMTQAAEFTFAALDHLLIGHQDFKTRVNELLHCASSLPEIEQSMPADDSYQRLVERCSSERTRLEEITCVHAETIDTFTKKKKQLNDLQEEISSTLDLLFQIEAEISCFKIEMSNMEIELEKISRGKEELEEKYLITSKELEESKKLFERKEADFNAAKAAFGRARALVRG